MHLHFEKNPDTRCDCSILSLSWMGKVPDNIPADEGWKLSRINYYQEGWLATGNMRGTVGVTFTSSNYKKNAAAEFPQRTNFNLRGHRSEVILVKWNEPYQKLASCDSSGIIFVWIKYEGRWSIELINDRNCPVTHFSWSHDGRMALICYQDGFVLVGSVSGQRYWSSMLNLESTITCGIWTPDDQQVYFGTTQGQIIVMDVHGAMVSQVQVLTDVGICSMAWSCEKFKMEEDEEMEPGVANANKRSFVLAVSFTNGFIYLMKSYDDLAPVQINTELNGSLGFHMEWSNSRELLAVAGTASVTPAAGQHASSTSTTAAPSPAPSPSGFSSGAPGAPSATVHSSLLLPTTGPSSTSTSSATSPSSAERTGPSKAYARHPSSSSSSFSYANMLKFYTQSGQLLFSVCIPPGPQASSPVSALTWGHSDKRLFVATGAQVHIAWVSRRVASLQLMCRLQIQKCIGPETALAILPLPAKIKSLIAHLYAQTIRCSVPNAQSLREFVSRPPLGTRLHCTMIRHDDEQNASGVCYTLYLEYLGGLVPLLKGKRTSKIRPEFVIFDPQINETGNGLLGDKSHSSSAATVSSSAKTDTSDSDGDAVLHEYGKGSPRVQRKRKTKSAKCRNNSSSSSTGGGSGATAPANAAATAPTAAANNGAAPNGASSSTDSRTATLLGQPDEDHELAYVDTLPEDVKLVEVNSNIWGTKFKIHGIAKNLPANLGQISYKTSLLHLQPRQMTVVVTELRDDLRHEPDPHFNPHIFSEDEDDCPTIGKSLPVAQRASVCGAASSSLVSLTPQMLGSDPPDEPEHDANANVHHLPPRPNRLLTRNVPHPLALGPLAKAESYDDDSQTSDVAAAVVTMAVVEHHQQPRNAPSTSRPSATSSYTMFATQFSRSSSNSSGQSRHAISPLCSDGAVPTLQSPKNAVAPSDIIFDRPPPNGLHSVHAGVGVQQPTTQHNVVARKRGNDCLMQFIDAEDGASSAAAGAAGAAPAAPAAATTAAPSASAAQHQASSVVAPAIPSAAVVEPLIAHTPTFVTISPTSIGRSCSVGFLDSVAASPLNITLMLRKDVTTKRLVLIDKKPAASTTAGVQQRNGVSARRTQNVKKLLVDSGKSKSFDSSDLRRVQMVGSAGSPVPAQPTIAEATGECVPSSPNAGAGLLTVPIISRVTEASETEEDSSSDIECAPDAIMGLATGGGGSGQSTMGGSDRDFLIYTPSASPTRTVVSGKQHSSCLKCKIMSRECQCKANSSARSGKHAQTSASDELSKLAVRAKREAIKSFADSPLFTRKHRFGDGDRSTGGTAGSASAPGAAPRSPNVKKHEFSFSFLKQLSEARRRKRDEQAGAGREEREVQEQVECESTAAAAGNKDPTDRSLHSHAISTLENIFSRLKDLEDSDLVGRSSSAELRQPRSSPASPAASKKKRNTSSSPIRQILNSPLLNRRNRKKTLIESSDEETPLFPNEPNDKPPGAPGATSTGTKNKSYQDLETFQKAQLRQKLKRGKIEPNGMPSVSQPSVLRREFVMHNKAPMWNENSQVYQLDFGGRVTQESAKNFQIEFRGQQVMQFGRIDGNAYTLDFQYPFSALQAFSVALANVTQRLK